MVREEKKWIRLFEKFKTQQLGAKKRFQLTELESYLKKEMGGATAYQKAGGYQKLYQLLKKLEAEEEIRAIKSAAFNQQLPQLKKRWSLLKNDEAGWPEKDILKLSRSLNLNYYLKRPQKQSAELKEMLFKLAYFLNNKAGREWASREERSLELFADEKFLSSSQGRKLLNNLKLQLAELKARQYKHLFVYWSLKPTQIKNILIMENHSAFIGAKKAAAAGINIFGEDFDTIIYGQGKKIVSSFSFLEELLGFEPAEKITADLKICYAGDLDPEGLAIYTALKDKYPEFKIKLLAEYYQLLLKVSNGFYPFHKKQNKNQAVLKRVLEEFEKEGFNELSRKVKKAWQADRRLPQELITLEVYQKEFT